MQLVLILTLLLFLQACRHPLAIEGQGDIVDLNEGPFGCSLEQYLAGESTCENEVSGDYFVNYAAIPRQGWRFDRWEGWCSPLSEGTHCRFDVSAEAVTFWDTERPNTPIGPLTAVFEPVENTAQDVVIVGAGSAGLYAARTLQDLGYEVLIIEATHRIGGRVKSTNLGDMRVDLGAEEHYLAAGGNPVWPAVIGEYGDDIYVRGYQGLDAYSMDAGTSTCWTKTDALNSCADDADVVAVNQFWNWYWRPNLHQDPVSSLADDVLSAFGIGPGNRAYHLYDAGIAGGSFATNLEKLGARSLALQSNQWDLSDAIRVLGDKNLGYADVLETIWWDDVVATGKLLLNSPVVRIDTSGESVIVTDAMGAAHTARQVIVTVSIGVLQSEMIDFVPDLPAPTVSAYNGIGIDMGMKVPMRFRSPWWETEGEQLGWLVTEGVAGACWAPSNYKVGTTANILMCYPMGANAEALNAIGEAAGSSKRGEAAIIAAILEDLDKTFPQARNQASTHYIEGKVQNWGAAPYTLGVYSYPKVGTYVSASSNLRKQLQQPIANNRIFFAGEASHISHPSTVVGALHEGERAARAVHAVNGAPNNPPPLNLD
ncbi:MAG: FAD-dependent oxidoreductase [Pseudomonadota bacterium]